LLNTGANVERGDKVLVIVKTEAKLGLVSPHHVSTKAVSFEIIKILKRKTKILHDLNLFSKIRPFRLNVILRVGPYTDTNFIHSVAKTVERMTEWNVKIDKSWHERLRSSFDSLDKVYEEWRIAAPTSRSEIVARAREIVAGLAPPAQYVEDGFKVVVYVFPEKYTFLEDVFGTKAYGEALNGFYAVVAIYPSVPEGYQNQEPCKDCLSKPVISLFHRQQMTSIFVIHEVLHIASDLNDHKGCQWCRYSRKEMQSLRRFKCEECVKEGNDIPQSNCLMSYDCLQCLATRISEGTVPEFLCEGCRKKLLPAEKFVARQAARINSLIYRHLFLE
jgi:hypothetical protein